ncbi:glycoside hydrolase family 2 protein [Thorsellia kenyensis]|uniref:Glycoside hydrolase family 2 protein n=1 Tax=Thorsellia kenyensis TaxID=1549888 RepID=A0ABV6CDB8_9GAMM
MTHSNATYNYNNDWIFIEGSYTSVPEDKLSASQNVTLPHNAVDLPYNYFDETCYQKPFTYQKVIHWEQSFENKQVWIQFDGAMANSHVYLNGTLICEHKDGYTPFEVNITPYLKEKDGVLTVIIDGSENPNIPPFGGQIDYLTYAGIYRHVWLKTKDEIRLKNIRAIPTHILADDAQGQQTTSKTAQLEITAFIESVDNAHSESKTPVTLIATLKDKNNVIVSSKTVTITLEQNVSQTESTFVIDDLNLIELWDVNNPVLYTLDVSIANQTSQDVFTHKIGFRQVKFTENGFLLNGRKLKIRGINRHQSYPYVGYAMGDHAQRMDADLVKKELKFNLVRTSHYPQAKSFLERCDELGLLVFEEIPGWQHIGDEAWQAVTIDSVKRMIERDWNHASIILWGVRINESPDNRSFYEKTNAMAKSLDISRQTGGVRCIPNSELLEDVYTMNDFVLNGGELALRTQQVVTGLDRKVPYMVTEFNGHMFPTKRFDPELHQVEHVTRHLRVMNAYYADESISGGIGWCLFDYNTHKDFGAGDRICYHGITDMFRIPKFAAYAYKSQCEPEEEIVLQPVTVWARGERPECLVLPTMILTNLDKVEFQVGDHTIKTVYPSNNRYPNLPHPPMIVDDSIISAEEFGLWGMKWSSVTMRGYLNGQCVKTVHMPENPVASHLTIASDYDSLPVKQRAQTRVIVNAFDQADNILWFIDDFITIDVQGDAKVIGPTQLILKGGAVGFWLEAGNTPGPVSIKVTSNRFDAVTLSITLTEE